MKAAGYIFTAAGFLAMICGGCICCEEVWAVPAVVFVAGVGVMALGMAMVDKVTCKAKIAKSKLSRHSNDADKLKLSEDMAAMHQEIIINEIWQ